MKATVVVALSAAVMLICAAQGAPAPRQDDRSLFNSAELAAIYRHSPLPPLGSSTGDRVADNPRAAELGQYLFFEQRFSASGSISCATCHVPAKAFTDGRKVAVGLAAGERNTPTLLNAAYNRWFFWDGRADSLWSQAMQPIENPKEFGSDRVNMVHVVAGDPKLRRAYEEVFGALPQLGDAPRHAYPDPDTRSDAAIGWAALTPTEQEAINRTFANLGKAIEAYERKLSSGDSAFDRYVKALRNGDRAGQRAYPDAAKRGLKLFVGKAMCELCHSGPGFSDEEFHNIGLPILKGGVRDTGRAAGIPAVRASIFNGVGAFSDNPAQAKDQLAYLSPPESQLGSFKTPSLRNVALTAPYGHDGRFKTLGAVLDFYAKGEDAIRGQVLVGTREATLRLVPRLSQSQIAELTAFLKTLTGAQIPSNLTRAPSAP